MKYVIYSTYLDQDYRHQRLYRLGESKGKNFIDACERLFASEGMAHYRGRFNAAYNTFDDKDMDFDIIYEKGEGPCDSQGKKRAYRKYAWAAVEEKIPNEILGISPLKTSLKVELRRKGYDTDKLRFVKVPAFCTEAF